MQTKKKIKVTCENCGDVVLNGREVTVIYNQSYVTYTFAFTHCGARQVRKLTPDEAVLVLRHKAKFMTTSKPRLSYRPGGPPLNEVDLNEFRVALNTHDHLAAYA